MPILSPRQHDRQILPFFAVLGICTTFESATREHRRFCAHQERGNQAICDDESSGRRRRCFRACRPESPFRSVRHEASCGPGNRTLLDRRKTVRPRPSSGIPSARLRQPRHRSSASASCRHASRAIPTRTNAPTQSLVCAAKFDVKPFPEIVAVLAESAQRDPSAYVRSEAVSSLVRIRPVSPVAGQAIEFAASKDDNWKNRMNAQAPSFATGSPIYAVACPPTRRRPSNRQSRARHRPRLRHSRTKPPLGDQKLPVYLLRSERQGDPSRPKDFQAPSFRARFPPFRPRIPAQTRQSRQSRRFRRRVRRRRPSYLNRCSVACAIDSHRLHTGVDRD